MPLETPRFDQTRPSPIDPDAALERARIMLGTRGFVVTVQGGRLLGQGPHLQSASDPAILGAGRVVLDVTPDTARLASDLSGLVRIRWFIIFAPPILAVALGLTMHAAGVDGTVRPALINALLWMVIGPGLVVWLRRRTERALSTLLDAITET